MTVLRYIRHWWQQFLRLLESSRKNPDIFLLEPILTPSYLFGFDFGGGELLLDRTYPESIDFDEYPMLGIQLKEIIPKFIAGFFTVGNTGKVEIDFLFEGWNDGGEVAIFSLAEMDESISDSDAFIRQAALRSVSHSPWGYTLPRDRLKTSSHQEFVLQPGDRFGLMFVSKGKVADIIADPQFKHTSRPLFSLATDNTDNDFFWGQMVDLTGEGNTFAIEDLRLDGQFEGELIFKLQGAIGQAPTPNDLDT
ncbi:MAG: DUF4114 domain-containing protein [Cyanobacteria bacterium SBLK]|nr:DUF4114 domain-containing protein [Cyanobacteria bacterium SBLK]